MPSTKTAPLARVHHRTGVAVHHVADMLRDILLRPHPDARRGRGNADAQQAHKHIQSGKSRAPETVARVLAGNGRWGEFGDACIAQDATRTVTLPWHDAVTAEAEADYTLRCALLAYEGGDRSARVLATIRESGKHLEHAAHNLALDAAQLQYARPRRSA